MSLLFLLRSILALNTLTAEVQAFRVSVHYAECFVPVGSFPLCPMWQVFRVSLRCSDAYSSSTGNCKPCFVLTVRELGTCHTVLLGELERGRAERLVGARRRAAGPPHRPAFDGGEQHVGGEQRHHRLKRAVDQALMLRGSRDFASVADYRNRLLNLTWQGERVLLVIVGVSGNPAMRQ